MSVGKRAYDIARAFIGRETERIGGLERHKAIEELEKITVQAENKTLAEGRITIPSGSSPEEHARKILGVKSDASFEEIKKAYDNLSGRSNPENFDEGSPERTQAEALFAKIAWAYEKLTSEADSSKKRFSSIEIGSPTKKKSSTETEKRFLSIEIEPENPKN